MDDGWTAFLDFANTEPGFAQGFEVGRLWKGLGAGCLPYKDFVFSVSAEHLSRLCAAYECVVSIEQLGDGWLEVTFEKEAA